MGVDYVMHTPIGDWPSPWEYHPTFHYTTPPKAPHKCPVCEGKGSLPAGFYMQVPCGSLSSTLPEQCRSCSGQGIIWS